MPVYQCQDCDEFFKSKDALQEHRADCSGDTGMSTTVFDDITTYVSGINFSLHPRRLRNMLTLRNAGIMFGVLMMATLFLGTASFMSSTAPNTGSPTGAATATSDPALGYSLQRGQTPPRLAGSEQPSQISSQPLSTEQQLWAITQGGQSNQPGTVIYYNCDDACPNLVEELSGFAESYPGWVYVAPNDNIGSRIVVTGIQFIQRYDSFDQEQLHSDICRYYPDIGVNPPIACETGTGEAQ